jgi:hypothetical protein
MSRITEQAMASTMNEPPINVGTTEEKRGGVETLPQGDESQRDFARLSPRSSFLMILLRALSAWNV